MVQNQSQGIFFYLIEKFSLNQLEKFPARKKRCIVADYSDRIKLVIMLNIESYKRTNTNIFLKIKLNL